MGRVVDILLRDLQDEFALARLIEDKRPFDRYAVTVRFCEAEDAFLSRLPIPTRSRIFETKLWVLVVFAQRRNLSGRNG